jgi:hypothetical protein
MKKIICFPILLLFVYANAQTEMDGLMMEKNYFCAGATYTTSNWTKYWEADFKRENLNLGKVTNNNVMINGNFGITPNLNAIFTVPYVHTKASAGQLAGQNGLQDLSIFLKWVAKEIKIKKATIKTILVPGFSLPLSNYTPDLLPLSIGTQSKTASIRAIIDYENNNWTGTISGTYMYRGNVKLDRNTYYTTRLHYSNVVAMPNAFNINVRAGYRSEIWIIEAIANQWITNGGFDISKNNMPFVSNNMDATTVGLHIKYETKLVNGLSFITDGFTTVAGRNVGQTNGLTLGAFYIMDFSKKKKNTKDSTIKAE